MTYILILTSRKAVTFTTFLLLVFLLDYGTTFTIQQTQNQELLHRKNDGIISKLPCPLAQASSLISQSSLKQKLIHILPATKSTSSSTSDELSDGDVIERKHQYLEEKQLDFMLGYLNKHHRIFLTKLAETFSELGVEKAKKNAWSGGSYTVSSANNFPGRFIDGYQ